MNRIYKCVFVAILVFCEIRAVELSNLCKIGQICTIEANHYNNQSIANNSPFSANTITFDDTCKNRDCGVRIATFINNSTITTSNNRSFLFDNNNRAEISHLINYGTITGDIYINSTNTNTIGAISNYGEMRGVWAFASKNITLNNQGILKTANDSYKGNAAHFFFETTTGRLVIENYAIKIIESQSEFNNFKGYADKANNKNSHLIIGGGSVVFKDSASKIIIDFGSGFEKGKAYLTNKLITNQNGDSLKLADFSRLTLKNRDFYRLTQSGEYFIVDFVGNSGGESSVVLNTEITELQKSNIKAMNNLLLQSNEAIFPRKFSGKTNRASSIVSRIQSANRISQPTASQNSKNHFVLMPFVAHNLYFNAGSYRLSGVDYGIIGAFSGDIGLGVHFGFSKGRLSDKIDKNFHISTMNFMGGLHYKLNMPLGFYLKARGDFFYFLNEISSAQVARIKPDNMGFGANLALGKDFDLGNAGILGVEFGADYKALSANKVSVKYTFDESALQTYAGALYHQIYADGGLKYYKYFAGGLGISISGGLRYNIAPQFATGSVIVDKNSLNFVMDNDRFLGYANAGISYALNVASFGMELGITYNGNFGNRSISNGGSIEWRFVW